MTSKPKPKFDAATLTAIAEIKAEMLPIFREALARDDEVADLNVFSLAFMFGIGCRQELDNDAAFELWKQLKETLLSDLASTLGPDFFDPGATLQ